MGEFERMKLSTRLMLAMVALVLLTATAVGVLAYRNVEAIALPRALAGIEMNTRVVATGLEASVAGVRADVNTQGRAVQGLVRASLAGGRDPVDGTPEARWRNSLADRFIADLAAKPAYMQFSLIGIADGGREIVRVDRLGPDGNIRVAPEADLEPETDKDFFDAAIGLHAGEVYAAPVAPDRLRGAPGAPAEPLLRVAAPVFAANGKPFGLLNVYVDPRPAFDRLRAAGPRDRAIYVVTERGDFFLRADSEREFGSESSRPARIQDEFPQLAPALTASEWQARVMPDRAGAAFGVALMPVRLAEGPRLNVIQAVPRDRLVATPTAARNATFLAAVVAVLGALALAGLLARSLTRPLAQITAAVDNFTATTPIQVPTEASGEVGVLARSFARVAREMQEATAALKKETEERRRGSRCCSPRATPRTPSSIMGGSTPGSFCSRSPIENPIWRAWFAWPSATEQTPSPAPFFGRVPYGPGGRPMATAQPRVRPSKQRPDDSAGIYKPLAGLRISLQPGRLGWRRRRSRGSEAVFSRWAAPTKVT
jgi:HAMP domain-containing protein